LNVAGHRIGTAEVESALVSNQKVAEAAVVGAPTNSKDRRLVAFVTLKSGIQPHPSIREELRAHVAKEIGPSRNRTISVSPKRFQKRVQAKSCAAF
jgi:acetyl-CoA synthetase